MVRTLECLLVLAPFVPLKGTVRFRCVREHSSFSVVRLIAFDFQLLHRPHCRPAGSANRRYVYLIRSSHEVVQLNQAHPTGMNAPFPRLRLAELTCELRLTFPSQERSEPAGFTAVLVKHKERNIEQLATVSGGINFGGVFYGREIFRLRFKAQTLDERGYTGSANHMVFPAILYPFPLDIPQLILMRTKMESSTLTFAELSQNSPKLHCSIGVLVPSGASLRLQTVVNAIYVTHDFTTTDWITT